MLDIVIVICLSMLIFFFPAGIFFFYFIHSLEKKGFYESNKYRYTRVRKDNA